MSKKQKQKYESGKVLVICGDKIALQVYWPDIDPAVNDSHLLTLHSLLEKKAEGGIAKMLSSSVYVNALNPKDCLTLLYVE